MNTRSRRAGLAFVAPWLAGFVLLTFGPLLASGVISLTRWDGLTGQVEYVGLDHYRTILTFDATDSARPGDPRFIRAVTNSLIYTGMAVPLGLVVSLSLALLLNVPLRGMAVFRTIIYLPYVLSGVATILMFQWLFNPDFGLVNAVLHSLAQAVQPLAQIVGLDLSGWIPPRWFYSEFWCKPALVIMSLFNTGGATLIFLAALQDVPNDQLDAASIDGAGRWRRFRAVTLPHISPALLFNLLIGTLSAMQAFNQAYLLSHYTQRDGLLFYVLYLYQRAFEDYQFGYAAALSWILFAMLLVISGVLLRSSRRWVHYAAG